MATREVAVAAPGTVHAIENSAEKWMAIIFGYMFVLAYAASLAASTSRLHSERAELPGVCLPRHLGAVLN